MKSGLCGDDGSGRSAFIDGLIEAEIRRLVLANGKGVVATGQVADEILRVYPGCMDGRALQNRILMAATAAGLSVEFGTPRKISR